MCFREVFDVRFQEVGVSPCLLRKSAVSAAGEAYPQKSEMAFMDVQPFAIISFAFASLISRIIARGDIPVTCRKRISAIRREQLIPDRAAFAVRPRQASRRIRSTASETS